MSDLTGVDENLFRQVPSFSSIDYVKNRIENLESFLRALPPVDADGNSECSFAKRLYERKESEFEPKLEEAIHRLYEDIRNSITHCDRVKQNMHEIQKRAISLHLAEPREKYDQAIARCQTLISNLNVTIERGRRTIHDAENVLARSQSTVWPDKKKLQNPTKFVPIPFEDTRETSSRFIAPCATPKDYEPLIRMDAKQLNEGTRRFQ